MHEQSIESNPALKSGSAGRRGEPGVRQCVVSRERRPKHELVRLVLGPDGQVAIDLLDKAPGRGVYVRSDRATLRKALSKKGIGRTFRGRAQPLSPEALESVVDDAVQRLDRRIVELVSIARRAQVAAVGMDAVLAALDNEPPATVVLFAADVSERSMRRVRSHGRGGLVPQADTGGSVPPEDALGMNGEQSRANRDRAADGDEGAGTEGGSGRHFIFVAADKADFGSKLGRKDVGVVAIRPSALATRIVAEALRRDGLGGSSPQSRAREEGLIRDNGEPAGGRSN